MTTSRRLEDLRAPFREKAERWQAACKAAGLDVLTYCTYRSPEEQARLYAQGRTTPGKIVTYAKPGESAHNHGLALDFVPLLGGKPAWRECPEYWQAIAIAEAEGMESAARWRKFKELPHLQQPSWRDYA